MEETTRSGREDLKTGTTTVGIKTKNAVVLGADSKATLGHLSYDLEAQKLYKITDQIAVTNAGSVGDSLTIIRFLRSKAKLYETDRETHITPKALTTFLSNVLNANRHFPYAVQFVIGGVVEEPQLFEVTPYGGILTRKRFATSGSGTQLALSVLDQEYEKNMSEEEGTDLVIKAIAESKKRDIYTGGRTVNIIVIDKKGIREIPEKEIEKKIKKLKPKEK